MPYQPRRPRRVSGSLTVVPGQVLTVVVGGTGSNGGFKAASTPGGSGYGQGGAGGVRAFGSYVSGGGGTVTISYLVAAPLAITTTSLPAATGGHFYTTTLQATGGTTPYSWSLEAGFLPPGLNLTSSTGVIHGFPDVTGTYSFKVRVTDSEATPQSVTSGWLSITVSGPAVTGVRPHVGPAFGRTPVRITGSGLSCPRFDPFCRVSVTFGGRPGRRPT